MMVRSFSLRAVNEFGLGESDAAERLGELTARDRHPLIGTTASESIVSAAHTRRVAPGEIEPLIEADCMEIQQRWWPYAFSRDGETLEEVIGKLLREHGRTLATAESCTGGWLGKRLVDVAGSSAYYLGGWVTYSNEMKVQMLGVPMELIEQHGAVSREVAESDGHLRAGAIRGG
jgi:nicotinamide-nucleotide amidase